jgi:hypothetical protein
MIGGIGVLIMFFYGFVNHMIWMILGFTCLSAGGIWLYIRIKSDAKALKNIAGESLKGKTVEVDFLRGVATLKISDAKDGQDAHRITSDRPRQLAGPESENINTLSELARLYEKKLISRDEYNKAKHKILNNTDQ